MLNRLRRAFRWPQAELLCTTQKRFFAENGYLILPGLFSQAQTAALKQHLDLLWQNRAQQPNIVFDSFYGQPNEARIHFRRATEEMRQHPYKLLDLDLEDEAVRTMCTEPRLMQIVQNLLGAKPLVCNSLLF